MSTEEIPLAGGNASLGVVRVGATVRKPWTAATPAVIAFTEWVGERGVDVPRPLGRDDHGRQIIEFVPGALAMGSTRLDLDALARVGRLVREIHDAAIGFIPPADAEWDLLLPAPGPEADLVCHNDLAPWNLIVGERWTFIDWDGAGPSTRLWDLAYAAQAFTLNDAAEPPDEAATRLAAFVAGYGADDALRAALPRTLGRRAAAMHALLRDAHETGREPWGTMYVEGHGEHWRAATAYVTGHEEIWRSALAAPAAHREDTA
ncbi:phosphotransferase [Leifsonia sp. WHRI 6310E]|uniref:phosphotransferase enzyme family protein n=1 Tax=Leifsonia sp. WHRI 6310E TaxID=3162562 RepID=UPI0032EE9A39